MAAGFVSKTVFLAGIIAAILISSGFSAVVSTQFAVGPQGEQGIQGVQGETGPQGLKGDRGVTGLQGAKGDTGAQGSKGDKGDPGLGVQPGYVAAPSYDSGWSEVTDSWMVFEHNLGTTDVLVQVMRNGPTNVANETYGIDQFKYGELLDYLLLNNQNITARVATIKGYYNDQVRVMMWKITPP